MGKFIKVIIRKVEPLFVSFIYSRLYFVAVLSLTSIAREQLFCIYPSMVDGCLLICGGVSPANIKVQKSSLSPHYSPPSLRLFSYIHSEFFYNFEIFLFRFFRKYYK